MKLATLLFALLISASAFCGDKKTGEVAPTKQNISLKGKVIDKVLGESLTGVAVLLDGTNTVVYTDLDGNFEITNVSEGSTITLSTSLISYKECRMSLIVQNNTGEVSVYVEPLDE